MGKIKITRYRFTRSRFRSTDISHNCVWKRRETRLRMIGNRKSTMNRFSFFFFFFLQFMYIELNFCVCRIIRNAASIFIFCQTHVSIFSPSIAPPILQDPFGWRISNDQHSVIHHVRTTNLVIVDSFAVNQNRSKILKVWWWWLEKKKSIERRKNRKRRKNIAH